MIKGKKQIKVLHVLDSLGMGGAETWIINLLKFWHQKDDKSIVFDFLITSGNPSVFDDEVIKLGSKIYYLKLSKNTWFSFVLNFRKVLKNFKYDAIHNHQDLLSGWLFFFGTFQLPKVRIAHFHNPYYQLFENYGISINRKFKIILGKILLKLYTTNITGTSLHLLSEYGINPKSFPSQKIEVLHCCFNLKDWDLNYDICKKQICDEFNLDVKVPIILFAGRFDYSLDVNHKQNHKNSVFALNIFEYYSNSSFAYFLMVGSNDFIKYDFQDLIVKKGLGNQVKLLGIRKDLNKIMAASNVLLFPSRAEGLGMVNVEAQANGMKVLASTAVPGESVVIEELVHFLDLQKPISIWAEKLKILVEQNRVSPTHIDERWEKSMFNIDYAVKYLIDLYI